MTKMETLKEDLTDVVETVLELIETLDKVVVALEEDVTIETTKMLVPMLKVPTKLKANKALKVNNKLVNNLVSVKIVPDVTTKKVVLALEVIAPDATMVTDPDAKEVTENVETTTKKVDHLALEVTDLDATMEIDPEVKVTKDVITTKKVDHQALEVTDPEEIMETDPEVKVTKDVITMEVDTEEEIEITIKEEDSEEEETIDLIETTKEEDLEEELIEEPVVLEMLIDPYVVLLTNLLNLDLLNKTKLIL